MATSRPDGGRVCSGLKRQLGLLDATTINLGAIIGSGIFIVPASSALALPATGPVLLVWVAGGLVSLAGALCIAERGYPVTPIIFITFSTYLVITTLFDTPLEAVVGAVMIVAGLAPYAYWTRRKKEQ